jgi:hypothetical protein
MSEQKLKELHETFDAMLNFDTKFLEAAKESMKFYTGSYGTGQWSDADLRKLREEGRPPLELNIILPKVNSVVGMERSQRTKFKAIPVGNSDDDEALLTTSLLYHLDQGKRLQNVFTRVHKDGVITGRGWISVEVEPGDDFVGKIKIKREPWYNVLMDPEADTPDCSEWARLVRTKFVSFQRLKQIFPDQLGDLKKVQDVMATDLDLTPPGEEYMREERGNRYLEGNYINESTYIDPIKEKARVVELWEREFVREYYLTNPKSSQVGNKGYATKKSAEEAIRAFNKITKETSKIARTDIELPEFNVIERIVPKTFYTIFSGGRLLIDKEPNPYSHNQFPLVPYFYYFEDTGGEIETFGVVENMKDPQREKNKRRSQALDIINRTPRGGGVYVQGSVTADEMNRASSAGEWVGISGLKGKSIREFMQQWSTAHLGLVSAANAMEERAAIDAKEISGATDPILGQATSSKESGFAAQTRIRQGMLTFQEQLENLDKMKRQTLRLAIKNMQQYYTRDKIERIIDTNLDNEDGFPQEAVTKFLNNFNNLEFDIQLDEGQDSATMRSLKAEQVANMIQMGFQDLFPLWLELSGLEAGGDILQRIEDREAARTIMQETKENTSQ